MSSLYGGCLPPRLRLGRASYKNETHPLRAGWVGRNLSYSLPARRHTHATTCEAAMGKANHIVRIEAGTHRVNRATTFWRYFLHRSSFLSHPCSCDAEPAIAL